MTTCTVGLGWRPDPDAPLDLDLSATLVGDGGAVLAIVDRDSLTAPGLSHSGNDATGAGEGDDEAVTVRPAELGAEVAAVVFSVTNRVANDFAGLREAYCRVREGRRETHRGDLADPAHPVLQSPREYDGRSSGFVYGRLERDGEGWRFVPVEHRGNGDPRNAADMLAEIAALSGQGG